MKSVFYGFTSDRYPALSTGLHLEIIENGNP